MLSSWILLEASAVIHKRRLLFTQVIPRSFKKQNLEKRSSDELQQVAPATVTSN